MNYDQQKLKQWQADIETLRTQLILSGHKGPWIKEKDRLEFTEHHFPCLVIRHKHFALAGYVGVYGHNAAFGLSADHLKQCVEVHGGVTYAGPSIEAIAYKGDKVPIHWIGFDCVHANDHVPLVNITEPTFYRTIEYVKEQTEFLALQLHLEEWTHGFKRNVNDNG